MEVKKIKGRKRHIVTDIMGNLLHVKVHPANQHDTKAACDVLERATEKHPSILAFSADAGYRGTAYDYVTQVLMRIMEISMKIKDEFVVLRNRWIVERTFAWLGNFRRLAKDFEITTDSQENMCRIAAIRLQLDRIN